MRLGRVELPKSSVYHGFDAGREPDVPVVLDYFAYLVRNDSRTIVVDTGFGAAEVARRPGRETLADLADVLRRLEVAPDEVEHLVLTHLHWDHIGNIEAFPVAEIVVPEDEVDYWTGQAARDGTQWAHTDPAGLARLGEAKVAGRVRTVAGAEEIFPGIEMIVVGGHSPGQSVLLIETTAGPLALASDAVHFYEERRLRRPFTVIFDLPRMHAAYELLDRLESEGTLVVPGHDAAVAGEFPPLEGLPPGLAVRLG